MRKKKLLSMVMAGTLAMTMAMPVMAAEGDTVNVIVTTKSAILRVAVPTSLAVAVDQFEMSDSGVQVYSGEFTMENKSEIAVKVGIESTADLKAGTKLVGTKAAAEGSTVAGEAWLAAAAQTSAGKYIETSGKDVGDLTEASDNVATFIQGTDANANKGTASQTFYLKKASAAYKLLNAGESAATLSYAQFYELTAETVGDADDLADLLKDNDVYVATAVAANGQALTFVAKGGTHTYNSSEVYYTAALTATPKASIDSTKLYVYADGTADATDGKAAFRYIGNLSGAQEEWSASDITNVHIKYEIVGVKDTKYDEVKAECTYGLYKKAEAAPSIATKTYTMTANTAIDITVDLGAGDLAATAVSKVMDPTGAWDYLKGDNQASYDASSKKITLSAGMVDACMSANVDHISVVFNDDEETTVRIDLTK